MAHLHPRVQLSLRMVRPLVPHRLRMVPSRATHRRVNRVNTNSNSSLPSSLRSNLPTRDRVAMVSNKGMDRSLDLVTSMVDSHVIDGM